MRSFIETFYRFRQGCLGFGQLRRSLLDYLDAQKEYRATELNYPAPIGSYPMVVNQLNLAAGREVIP